MSLEEAIKENTVVVRALGEAFSQAIQLIATGKVALPAKAAAPKKGVEESDTHEVKAETENTKPIGKPKPLKKPAPFTAGDSVDKTKSAEEAYEPVRKATFAFAAEHGRPALLEIFAEFGIKTATELKPNQYNDYLSKLSLAESEQEVA